MLVITLSYSRVCNGPSVVSCVKTAVNATGDATVFDEKWLNVDAAMNG
jgi:hypothetical protein